MTKHGREMRGPAQPAVREELAGDHLEAAVDQEPDESISPVGCPGAASLHRRRRQANVIF